jgi:hypothetical protein
MTLPDSNPFDRSWFPTLEPHHGEGRRGSYPPVKLAVVVDEGPRIRAMEAEIIRLNIIIAERDNQIVYLKNRQFVQQDPQGMMRCSRCRAWLLPEKFVIDRTRKTGRRSNCRVCDREWREAHS